MKSKWKTKRLGDISTINYGYTAKASFNKADSLFLRITDIQDNFVDWKTVPYCSISEIDYEKYKLIDNDIVFARTGATTGKSYLIKKPPKSVAASYLIRLRLTDCDILPEFIAKYFQTPTYWNDISLGIVGSAQGGFNASKLSDLIIPVPPIEEQKRIVEILDKAFEGIAQAEANTRRNLINARELFDSYLASIHSDREKLRNLVDIRTGKLNSNAAEENGIYPFFTCSRDVYRINDYAFDCEAILLAGNNASGDFNVKHYSGKFNAYQRTYVITINPEKRVVYRYLYYQLLHSLKEFKQKSVGAATKFLKIGIIQDMEIPLPNIYEQNKIVVNLDSLQTKTQKLETIYQRKLEAIAELKQSILEKAFTGQLSQ
ncbi:type-1 restriction enzyme EcoKI specificity protein [Microcystis aeruginosa Sj]|uniref:Type-1 restriction enzyme EcoKI specificity protein n=1 Tax=Microcystis aeruginosa Sj TaxID=1979544 RepID=A0A2Z6V3A4_MICAE|nr:restriction endonuclease subunit S [Microcystis aeruginosa]GBL12588.1 type-1 restriction enzyme EcoKI specificity protein [Microcystis aeruginosa Sj]